ncbi:Putative CCAAT-binding factor [Septoria linicola]|uniref:CCAAT-binding factor n=1 Tax=Septoria linicola TaxID=215465 RepID=A0A9Q9AK47_9PEZI|nr:putative CCAAT-binding factor [Septoria linicola]USW47905.1 Putative CCAAT-binding factor [Septoria linicola]
MSAKRKSLDHDPRAKKDHDHGRPSKKARSDTTTTPTTTTTTTAAPPTKQKQKQRKDDKPALLFHARPDWYAAELPPLDTHEAKDLPSQRTIENLLHYATALLEAENAAYNDGHLSGSSSHKFLSTIMASGTLEDKVSALTLLVQESPLHTMKAFDNLLNLSKKKSRNQALMAVAALKDMLGQGNVLPGDRKLRPFGKQPQLLGILQGKDARWNSGDPLPGALTKEHLVTWAFEDWLKKKYFELLAILETWCNDEIEYSRQRALTYVWELLKDKPEQEENLLRLLVNKLGDTERKVASRASHLLLQLENTHPAMKQIVTNSIEADCLYRPGQSDHAKYYAIITLNQTILSRKDEELANRLLEIYFGLFVQLLKPAEAKKFAPGKDSANATPLQGGGGKAGKMAAKKRKAEEKNEEAAVQFHDKMISQVLAGVNRAFAFADMSDPNFEKQLDTVFRVAHSANFNTSIQALMLLQQISSRKHFGADRFYRTLYESLLDPRLFNSSKQVMYLNLLYKSLKADLNAKRVQAFVKRMLQVITMHEPAFACGVLYLIHELEGTFPSIRKMISEPEIADEDEEEHFVDVPEDGSSNPNADSSTLTHKVLYDPRKRDPEHSQAERTCLWDLLPLLRHFHPSVALFAEAVSGTKEMPPKPDPTQHSLMHFLDRFVYRNPKTKQEKTHGSSIMQPLAGAKAADLLVKPGDPSQRAPLNSEAFWAKKVENVAADEVFFHNYFNAAGNAKKKPTKEKKQRDPEDSEDEDAMEDQIWEAIANSRPEVEGPGSDDELSMGDLESLSGGSDDESEGGIDLGGEDGDGAMDMDTFAGMDGFGGDDGEAEDDLDSDDMPDLDDDDEDAMRGDDDDVPFDGFGAEEEDEQPESNAARNKKKRADKKKLKNLPVFASAEDYAKLIGDDDDDV